MLVAALVCPPPARAQSDAGAVRDLLYRAVPGASRFSEKQGDPPVFHAFRVDAETGRETLAGYAFLSSDLPPEEMGYNGPIQVLVGMDLEGTITGVVVVDYYESHRATRGDFLRVPRFQEQFAGKRVGDPFRVRLDVDNLSGATISVGAMARGVRNSARRVATAYLSSSRVAVPVPLHPGTVTAEQLESLTWLDVVDAGLVQRMTILERDAWAIEVSTVYLRDDAMGAILMGREAYEDALARVGGRAGTDHVLMVGVDGPLAALFRATALYVVQDGDTLRMTAGDLHMLGAPRAGKIGGQFGSVGVLVVDADAVDAQRPFTTVFDLRPGMGYAAAEFPGLRPPPPPRVAAGPEGPNADAEAGPPEEAGGAQPSAAAEEGPEAGPSALEATAEGAVEPDAEAAADEPAGATDLEQLGAELPFAFDDVEEGTLLGRTLATTSWPRVAGLVLLLALAGAAFAAKVASLRWVALAATFLLLGVVDGGFLSVSHITSGIRVGPSVYLADLPLLLLVSFTVVTTLLWGRVFCGFLCPFGALQDFLEKVVPRRFRREPPRWLHERALLVKYGVLVLVLVPVILGSSASLYQYVEPFGTVFFLSTSLILWLIAGGILVAAAVVPRFYCRYVCPLGAALAVVSTVSPLRIRRVEQCGVCKVCEQRCPTGAIRGPAIDFKECVRCNICETALIERAGVCRHDMEEVRPRLVQLGMAPRGGIL